MQISATVRVKASHGGKPDRRRLEEAAKLLRQSGFNVLRIGRFGVSIRGDDRDFSRVLGVKAEPNCALKVNVSPEQGALRRLVDLVEITPSPQYF
jgi:hypothetical protein